MDGQIENLDDIVICPNCDAAYHLRRPGNAERAVCARCHTVLIEPRRKAGKQIIAIALAVVVLVIAAISFPFLTIRAGGVTNSVSIIGTALAFESGLYRPLALAMILLIVGIPLSRAALTIYVLLPIVRDRPFWPGAQRAFRWVERLRPWSMTEIFVLGCAVALTKVADLADIRFGAAFWLFAALVVLVLVKDNYLCRWSVWNSLSKTTKA